MTITETGAASPEADTCLARPEVSDAARAGGAVLVLLALVVMRLLWQGRVDAYVRPAMAIPLAIAGGLIAALGVSGLIRRPARVHPDDDDSEHGPTTAGLPRTCWLLVLPVIVLTLIAPGPLAASGSATAAPPEVPFHATVLHPDASGDIDIKLRDLLGWATDDPQETAAAPAVTADRDGGERVAGRPACPAHPLHDHLLRGRRVSLLRRGQPPGRQLRAREGKLGRDHRELGRAPHLGRLATHRRERPCRAFAEPAEPYETLNRIWPDPAMGR